MTYLDTLSALLFIGPFGVPELLLILVILVVIFGASKLPQLGKGMGEGIRNFKHGLRDDAEREGEPAAPPSSTDRPA